MWSFFSLSSFFSQMDLAMNVIAHGANQFPANAGPTLYPQMHGFVTQGGDTQPSTNAGNLPPSDASVDGAGTDISTGQPNSVHILPHETHKMSSDPSSNSQPVPSVYNSKEIFREDQTSILVREYLDDVPLKYRTNVFRNIIELYKDDFVNRLLIYDSNPDIDASATSSTSLEEKSHVGPHIELNKGKFGSYAECKACYAEIKLSDKPSFDSKEWEHHSAKCLARQENSKSKNFLS
jgi:hypothetical protein